jgi:hypothetical protein
MEYIEKLTEYQQNIFDVMLNMSELKQNYLLSSEDRGIGKSTILNKLSFTLQALGYCVCLLTPFPREYFATNIISLYPNDYRGINKNSVVIVDETRYGIMMDDFLDYCKLKNIPVIGFVNFEKNKVIIDNKEIFEKEFDFKWNIDFSNNFKNETSL